MFLFELRYKNHFTVIKTVLKLVTNNINFQNK